MLRQKHPNPFLVILKYLMKREECYLAILCSIGAREMIKTFKEFYVDYQPWITLIYLAIFAGPVVGFFLMR